MVDLVFGALTLIFLISCSAQYNRWTAHQLRILHHQYTELLEMVGALLLKS
jgi:hypothetical protein